MTVKDAKYWALWEIDNAIARAIEEHGEEEVWEWIRPDLQDYDKRQEQGE